MTVYLLDVEDYEGPPLAIVDDDDVAVGNAIANLLEAMGFSPEEVRRPEGTDVIRWADWLYTLAAQPWLDGVDLEFASTMDAAGLQEVAETFETGIGPETRRKTEDVVVAGGVL